MPFAVEQLPQRLGLAKGQGFGLGFGVRRSRLRAWFPVFSEEEHQEEEEEVPWHSKPSEGMSLCRGRKSHAS